MKRHHFFLAIGSAAALLIMSVFIRMSDRYQKTYDQKFFFAFALQSSVDLREKIARELIMFGHVSATNKTIPTTNSNFYNIDFYKLTETGSIIIFKNSVGALLVLEPRIRGNNVEWSCAGFPIAMIPRECKK